MECGNLLAKTLHAFGATKAFGVPGESFLALLNGLYDLQGAFDFVTCRQEGGAAHMAAAYGKLTGEPGICLVTRGPGATNAAIGVHTARQDSVPMLLFVGQVATTMRDREAFQELDYRAVFGTMAKWVVEIDDPARLPELVARAWRTAVNGRPGPVVVALPEDMLSAPVADLPSPVLHLVHEPEPAQAGLARLQDLLGMATQPVILMGGCNWADQGRADMQAFAERARIPVLSVFRYQDQFDNFSRAFAGEAGVGMIPAVAARLRAADLILAVNNRFGETSTGGYSLLNVPVPRQRLVHVHADVAELGKVYQPDLAIQAGPNAFAHALSQLHMRPDPPWVDWFQQARADYEVSFDLPPQPSPVDMGQVMAQLQARLPEDAILTHGAGNFAVWLSKFYKFGARARLLAPQSGAMGYGVPAAIAAKVAQPQRTVLCFAGDGDFQMTLQELATARQAQACPVILILNNGIYGTIRAHQERTYPARVIGTHMVSPDFTALAQAYGFYGERVDTTADFADAFDRALAAPEGAVLDLNISAEALSPRQTLSAMRAEALDGEQEQGSKL